MHVNLCKETTNIVIIVHLAEHPGPLQISSDLNHCAQSRKLPSERICLRVHDLSIQFIFKNRLAFLCYAQCEHMPGNEIWAPHDEQSLQDFFLQPPSLPSNDQCDQSYAFRQVCGWTTLERLQRKDACLENHLPSDRLREGQINLSFLHQNNEHEDYYIIDDIVWYTAAWEPQYIIMIYIKILYYMSMDIESHTGREWEMLWRWDSIHKMTIWWTMVFHVFPRQGHLHVQSSWA